MPSLFGHVRCKSVGGRRFMMESLESRCLLACDFFLQADGTLHVSGDELAQHVEITDLENGEVSILCQERSGDPADPNVFQGVTGLVVNLSADSIDFNFSSIANDGSILSSAVASLPASGTGENAQLKATINVDEPVQTEEIDFVVEMLFRGNGIFEVSGFRSTEVVVHNELGDMRFVTVPNSGDGTTEHFFTVEFSSGRFASGEVTDLSMQTWRDADANEMQFSAFDTRSGARLSLEHSSSAGAWFFDFDSRNHLDFHAAESSRNGFVHTRLDTIAENFNSHHHLATDPQEKRRSAKFDISLDENKNATSMIDIHGTYHRLHTRNTHSLPELTSRIRLDARDVSGEVRISSQPDSAAVTIENAQVGKTLYLGVIGFSGVTREIHGLHLLSESRYQEIVRTSKALLIVAEDVEGEALLIAPHAVFASKVVGGDEANRFVSRWDGVFIDRTAKLQQSIETNGGDDRTTLWMRTAQINALGARNTDQAHEPRELDISIDTGSDDDSVDLQIQQTDVEFLRQRAVRLDLGQGDDEAKIRALSPVGPQNWMIDVEAGSTGFFPESEDEVVVEFVHGEVAQPVLFDVLYNGKDRTVSRIGKSKKLSVQFVEENAGTEIAVNLHGSDAQDSLDLEFAGVLADATSVTANTYEGDDQVAIHYIPDESPIPVSKPWNVDANIDLGTGRNRYTAEHIVPDVYIAELPALVRSIVRSNETTTRFQGSSGEPDVPLEFNMFLADGVPIRSNVALDAEGFADIEFQIISDRDDSSSNRSADGNTTQIEQLNLVHEGFTIDTSTNTGSRIQVEMPLSDSNTPTSVHAVGYHMNDIRIHGTDQNDQAFVRLVPADDSTRPSRIWFAGEQGNDTAAVQIEGDLNSSARVTLNGGKDDDQLVFDGSRLSISDAGSLRVIQRGDTGDDYLSVIQRGQVHGATHIIQQGDAGRDVIGAVVDLASESRGQLFVNQTGGAGDDVLALVAHGRFVADRAHGRLRLDAGIGFDRCAATVDVAVTNCEQEFPLTSVVEAVFAEFEFTDGHISSVTFPTFD